MRFFDLCKYLSSLESHSDAKKKVEIVSELFTHAETEEVDKLAYLMKGGPWHKSPDPLEISINKRPAIKSLAKATGYSEQEVRDIVKKEGTIELAAEQLVKKKQVQPLLPTPLTVSGVYESLRKIAESKNSSSQSIKIRTLTRLTVSATPLSAKFIYRFMLNKFTLGVPLEILAGGLAAAFLGRKDKSSIIEEAYNKYPDIGKIARITVEDGTLGLRNVEITPGQPIRLMRAKGLGSVEEIMKKVDGKAAVEWIYDGKPCQIHLARGKLWVFSDTFDEISPRYPDLVNHCKKGLQPKEVIVEGVIVPYTPKTRSYRLYHRFEHKKNEKGVRHTTSEPPVKVFLYDLLYRDGKSYLSASYQERRKGLTTSIKENDKLALTEKKRVKTPEEVENLLIEAIEKGQEGVIVKKLGKNSSYKPGKKTWNWIKYKRSFKSKMIDTVDLVAVGAFGNRGPTKFKYDGLLFAAYDPENDTFPSVCKVSTGFTHKELGMLSKKIEAYLTDVAPSRILVNEKVEPDYWIQPKIVAEIGGAELTLSHTHKAGYRLVKEKVEKDAGLTIRFPQFVQWRPGKSEEAITTSRELVQMYFALLERVR
ncbi:MAG: ATP-dependent DNA ligase [Candidatus Korarchaeota archaeon]|nr:ATP-dependent DNA ligase [Candidatus Korarchaeota archaeon]NIU83271.1 ATP-dependent DNA ligase [Candidatus Thorarchaeota archaeon]NIW13615.1 ATP-dependent DNA ligase [Candidatus Thorarchaeota archaeon]NIW51711.1 ATP-dependent DNA ligase [Candidatus Korarchaeota archaeon]